MCRAPMFMPFDVANALPKACYLSDESSSSRLDSFCCALPNACCALPLSCSTLPSTFWPVSSVRSPAAARTRPFASSAIPFARFSVPFLCMSSIRNLFGESVVVPRRDLPLCWPAVQQLLQGKCDFCTADAFACTTIGTPVFPEPVCVENSNRRSSVVSAVTSTSSVSPGPLSVRASCTTC